MRDHDDETLIECLACGAAIDPEVDRAFPVSEGLALCLACAVARGGVYDEAGDTWVRSPDVADLAVAEP